jgi:membrane protein
LLKLFNLNGRDIVQSQMGSLMGEVGKNAAATMIDAAKQQSGIFATVISLVVLLFGASGVFAELQDSLNTIWEVQPDPKAGIWDTVKKRFFSLAMVFGVIFLLLVSLILSSVLSAIAGHIGGSGAVVGIALDVVFSLIVYSLVFGLIFMYLPDVKIRFRDTWLGALLTAVLFTIGKYLLTWYLTKGSTASAYGAAGSLAALLVWVYYSAQILFFGAEFTQVYARKYGSRIVPERGAVPMTEEQRAQRGLVREHDLQAAKTAEEQRASQKGGVFGAPQPALCDPRVVTITRPESNSKLAVAGLGVATGLVVGAMGLLKGRKYVDDGIEQIYLDRRLQRLERHLGSAPVKTIDLNRRLNALDAHVRSAVRTVHHRNNATRPRWMRKLSELVSP